MGNLAERKRQRREYLRKKRSAYSSAGLAGILFIPAVIGTLLCFALTVVGSYWSVVGHNYGSHDFGGLLGCLLLAGLTTAGGFAVKVCGSDCKKGMAAASHYPYVPPVTTDTLSAEEILVRASAEPPIAQPELLLRAVAAGQEETGEELLRAAGGE